MVQIRDGKVKPYSYVCAGSTVDQVSVTQARTTVYSVAAFNHSSASVAYLHIFDSSVALSSGAAVQSYTIPYNVFVEGSTRAAVGGGFTFSPQYGFNLENGLAYVISGGSGSSAFSTALAGLVTINLTYESGLT